MIEMMLRNQSQYNRQMDVPKSNDHHFFSPDPLLIKVRSSSQANFDPSPFNITDIDHEAAIQDELSQGKVVPLKVKKLKIPSPTAKSNQHAQEKSSPQLNYLKIDQFPILQEFVYQQSQPKMSRQSIKDMLADYNILYDKQSEGNEDIQNQNKQHECSSTQKMMVKKEDNQQVQLRNSQNGIVQIQYELGENPLISQRDEDVRAIVDSRHQFMKGAHKIGLKVHLSRSLPLKQTLSMQLAKSSDLLSIFWPEFHLRFNGQTRPLVAAKRTSFKPYSTYIISLSSNDFEKSSSAYLGKVKGNLQGTVVNVYGPGLNPSDAQKHHQIPRQVIATIVYGQVQAQAPRRFSLFVKKEQFHYYLAFPQIKMYRPQIPLNELYREFQNRDKIDVFSSRKPIYDPRTSTYALSFHGKVRSPSVRNFILEDEDGSQLILLGKVRQDRFNLQISSPITPLIGFAVALSSFDPLWL